MSKTSFRFFRKKGSQQLQLIHLGGQGEIGKNMTLLRYGGNILIIDCGMKFPDDDMPGVDKLLPDMSYVSKHKDLVRGLILTHGHEDHIGAIPYLLREINVPIYGTKLTLGLVERKLKEFKLPKKPQLHIIKPKDEIKLGPFVVEPIRVCHSIPDAVAFAVRTPLGIVVHTGDVKIDYCPIDKQQIDLPRFGDLGREGVLLMLSDSTNADSEGSTPSESTVAKFFDKFLDYKNGRILVASFASNIHRIQQVFDYAAKYGKKVAISGLSMQAVTEKAKELGYLHYDSEILVKLNDISRVPHNKLLIITTGSQGEPMAALSRMAAGEHKQIKIQKGDRIIISATPIPGNEKAIYKTINNLCRLGAEVIYEERHGLHVSGHGAIEDMKMLLKLVKPKYFVPAHGEFRHMVAHAKVAEQCGIRPENIFIDDNGDSLVITKDKAVKGPKIPIANIFVDGTGVGDISPDILRERNQLAEGGLIIVSTKVARSDFKVLSDAEIETKGFVFVRTNEDLMKKSKEIVRSVLGRHYRQRNRSLPAISQEIQKELGKYIAKKTERRPVIIAIINQA
ncbi:MAG: ribonuclease J [Candidatus Margulisiibacteriota bacterium]